MFYMFLTTFSHVQCLPTFSGDRVRFIQEQEYIFERWYRMNVLLKNWYNPLRWRCCATSLQLTQDKWAQITIKWVCSENSSTLKVTFKFYMKFAHTRCMTYLIVSVVHLVFFQISVQIFYTRQVQTSTVHLQIYSDVWFLFGKCDILPC